MLTIEIHVGFAKKAKVSTLAVENLEQELIARTSLPLTITAMTTTHSDLQMLIEHTTTRLTGSHIGEEAPDYDDDEENDPFPPYVALDDVTIFEIAELDEIALLADIWDSDLHPEVSAQLVQASAQGYL